MLELRREYRLVLETLRAFLQLLPLIIIWIPPIIGFLPPILFCIFPRAFFFWVCCVCVCDDTLVCSVSMWMDGRTPLSYPTPTTSTNTKSPLFPQK